MADKKVILKNERYADDSQFWCPECHILMQYKYAGKFVCEKCGSEQYNDFGKIKNILMKTVLPMPLNCLQIPESANQRLENISDLAR